MKNFLYQYDVKKDKFYIFGFGELDAFSPSPSYDDQGFWVDIFEINKFSSPSVSRDFLMFLGSFFDFLPKHDPKKHIHQLPSLIWKSKNIFLNEVIFYAGSFNPWHLGHEACLLNAESHGLILVMPDNNPWKEIERDECQWKYFKELCLKYENSPFCFYPGFMGMNEKNPTINWLPKVICPNKVLLMGDDSFLGILKWQNADLLLKHLTKILIVPRNVKDEIIFKEMEMVCQKFPWLKLLRLHHHDHEDLSSTKLRLEKTI